jgi:hypothetical protein
VVLHAISTVEFLAGKTRGTHYMLPHATFSFPKTMSVPSKGPIVSEWQTYIRQQQSYLQLCDTFTSRAAWNPGRLIWGGVWLPTEFTVWGITLKIQ